MASVRPVKRARGPSQPCPVCGTSLSLNPRYPRYLCGECAKQASDKNGRLLNFSNTSLGGGFEARYAQTSKDPRGKPRGI